MTQFCAHRCKRGAEAAKQNAAAATTEKERKRWLHTEKVWRSRWSEIT